METIKGCADAVTELAGHGLVAMVEPLPYRREDDGSLRLLKDVPSLARAVTDRQRPRHDERLHLAEDALVRRPRGGLRGDDPAVRRARRRAARRPGRGPRVLGGRSLTQPSVRGLVVGRALLYPPDGEVFAAVDAAAAVLRAAGGEQPA